MNGGGRYAVRVLAVVVLYRRAMNESEACVSFQAIADERYELVVCDNSPTLQDMPEGFERRYFRDPTNAGLAASYTRAMQYAEANQFRWLMLLDQDTTVTSEFLDEVQTALAGIENGERDNDIVALVPQLTENGVVCSPVLPPRYGPAQPQRKTGVAVSKVHAFNSGAVMRVEAVASAGGFPKQFPLDYLDHAMFTTLQNRGGKVLVLSSRLLHQLSSNAGDEVSLVRYVKSLDAEARFYRTYGSGVDRALRRWRLLRAAIGRVVRNRTHGVTRRMLKAALWR